MHIILKSVVDFRINEFKLTPQRLGIQLFRERLSEKVHATIPKGIVGGFECTILQRNLKEWHGRPRTYVCDPSVEGEQQK